MNKWTRTAIAGGLAGIALSQIIALIISWTTGTYAPCAPEMTAAYGELPAATIQTITTFLLGTIFALANKAWETNWSLTRQTLTVYLTYMLTYLAVAWTNFWIQHDWQSALRIILVFTLIFAILWIRIWKHIQKSINEINHDIHKEKEA